MPSLFPCLSLNQYYTIPIPVDLFKSWNEAVQALQHCYSYLKGSSYSRSFVSPYEFDSAEIFY